MDISKLSLDEHSRIENLLIGAIKLAEAGKVEDAVKIADSLAVLALTLIGYTDLAHWITKIKAIEEESKKEVDLLDLLDTYEVPEFEDFEPVEVDVQGVVKT